MGVQYQHLNREERVAIMLHLILESKHRERYIEPGPFNASFWGDTTEPSPFPHALVFYVPRLPIHFSMDDSSRR